MMEESNGKLVSIIVPVYQVKEYVGECVESLRAQTYTNLEILLVDDGSTDGSGEICDEYVRSDNRIRVIHQKNRGLSAARNTGLDQAAGEYVAFVDSDDVVLPDFIETLYDLSGRYQADIAACAFVRGNMEEIGGTAGSGGSARDICMTSEQMLRQWHGKYKKWETIACNKLYRKQILNGTDSNGRIRFPISRRHEDVLTSHLIVANASRIVLTTRKLYLYRTREGSITTQTMKAEQRRENLRAQRERMVFFKERRYWRAYLNLLTGYVMHVGWFAWVRVRG